MADVCKLCGEKLDKKAGDALFYCIKCQEKQKKIKERIRNS